MAGQMAMNNTSGGLISMRVARQISEVTSLQEALT
jgi:hypothetical protein